VGEYYESVKEGVMFAENIELLIYSTPVRCLGVGWGVVEMERSVSDNANGSHS
jgi:hypothetical protein